MNFVKNTLGRKPLAAPLAILLLLALLISSFAGCSDEETVNAADAIVLRVANCEEYIDLGEWDEEELIELDSAEIFGENALYEDFADWYYETYGVRVKVEYSTYGTNEELYNQMNLGNVFDLVCPSDYMIQKLMDEGRLEPLSESFFDTEDENNYYVNGVSPYIDGVFHDITQNGEPIADYAACYMWGTMGLVYNPDELSEEDVAHWSVVLNEENNRRVTMKDSVRDSLFVSQCIRIAEMVQEPEFLASENYYDDLTALLNDTSAETIDVCEGILSEMRKNAYCLETDSAKGDMITGKVIAATQWSGDAVYTMDQAEEDDYYLNYSVPEECTNLWFDGWVMMANGINGDAAKKQAAEAFLNYISMPESVVRNMYYIGYTSGISGGDSSLVQEYLEYCYGAEDEEEEVVEYDLSYFFGEDYVIETPEEQTHRQLFAQYPTEEVINRACVMSFFDSAANERVMRMWTNIRCFDLADLF